jgi:DNA helicase II / ATP-dependent DNA helicase PcrA
MNSKRVRVVRAAPGSGKTWLVAEIIRTELSSWSSRTTGLAALSFTRVGGDEIRRAVGYDLLWPHFVGTIDAFLFRYLVRPFLGQCFHYPSPRLLPASWGAENWSSFGTAGGSVIAGKGINLCGCVFIGETEYGPTIASKRHHAGQLQRLDEPAARVVRDAKKELWRKSGRITHSDGALLASKILCHAKYGSAIREELVRRFPLIIVDELQDTGYFLGRSILSLVDAPPVRAVLVGDPDQAIYEFNGARPDLFRRFESISGALTLSLRSTQRCPARVASAATHLRESGGSLEPAPDRSGVALLLRYADMASDVNRLIDVLARSRGAESIKVVARHTSTVLELTGRTSRPAPKLGSPALNHLHRAVVAFRNGHSVAALAASRATIEQALFGHEGVEDSELLTHGVEADALKRLAVETLLRANAEPIEGSLYDWQERLGTIVDALISASGMSPSMSRVHTRTRPRRMTKKAGRVAARSCTDFVPVANSPLRTWRIPVETVHAVKGETHDLTILVCPDARGDRCPSVVWWSTDDTALEEKRIAYVAMTRTRGDLIVAVSNSCYERLEAARKAFVSNFECMTVDAYIDACSGTNSPLQQSGSHGLEPQRPLA